MMRKPNFFVIGHTRSGGTSLEINLVQHPDIFIISYKKGYFGFDTDLKSEEEYLSLFSKATTQKRIGERAADYIMCPSSASRLKKFAPDAKIMAVIRNPIDVMYSVYTKMFLLETIENIPNFEDALKTEGYRIEQNQARPGSFPPQVLYRTIVKYAQQIARYHNEFGRENVKIVIFDDIVKNPTASYKEIFEFLDVDSSFVPDFRIINQNRASRSRTLQLLIKKSPKLTNALGRIPGTKMLYQNINLPLAKREPMNPELRKKLQQEFLPEVEELSQLLGRDLTFWCK